jgi:hypothetical protein
MKRSATGIAAALGAVLLWLAASALASERGVTADGRAYVSGGIGLEERAELQAARTDFSLRIVVAARGSGAFLSDVPIRIDDAEGRRVLDIKTAGPVLLVDLAPGRYRVEALANGETKHARTVVGRQGGREIYFHFDLPVEVLSADAEEKR